jgi:hypothetical protein
MQEHGASSAGKRVGEGLRRAVGYGVHQLGIQLGLLIAGVASGIAARIGIVPTLLSLVALICFASSIVLIGHMVYRHFKGGRGASVHGPTFPCRAEQARLRQQRDEAQNGRRLMRYVRVHAGWLADAHHVIEQFDRARRLRAQKEHLTGAFADCGTAMAGELGEPCAIHLMVFHAGALRSHLRPSGERPLPADGPIGDLLTCRARHVLDPMLIEDLADEHADMSELKRRGFRHLIAHAVWVDHSDAAAVAVVIASGEGPRPFGQAEAGLLAELAAHTAALWDDGLPSARLAA